MTAPISLNDLELTVRVHNVLAKQLGCRNSADIVKFTAAELMRQPNFGKVSLVDLREALAQFGLYLAGEAPPAPPTKEKTMNVIEHILALLNREGAPINKYALVQLLRDAAESSGAFDRDDFSDPFLLELDRRLVTMTDKDPVPSAWRVGGGIA